MFGSFNLGRYDFSSDPEDFERVLNRLIDTNPAIIRLCFEYEIRKGSSGNTIKIFGQGFTKDKCIQQLNLLIDGAVDIDRNEPKPKIVQEIINHIDNLATAESLVEPPIGLRVISDREILITIMIISIAFLSVTGSFFYFTQ